MAPIYTHGTFNKGAPDVNVLIADKFERSGVEGLAKLGCKVADEPSLASDQIPDAIRRTESQILIVRSKKVPAAVIERCDGLKGIIRAGAGVDNIDLPSATAKGIAVCNCPGMNAVAVAELAMGHIICCDRRIAMQTFDARAGVWNKKEYAAARGLKGSRLGIIGFGAIAHALVARAKAFDMQVVAWSRNLTIAKAAELGIEFGGSTRADLLEMVAACDFVSVHVAAVPETRNLCDSEFFAAMKSGAGFVNTSRGSVVDEAALAKAISSKGLRAGLDVYQNQPPTPQANDWSCPLASLPNVTCTHHAGASTDQAQEAVAAETVRIVSVFLGTGRFINCVNQ